MLYAWCMMSLIPDPLNTVPGFLRFVLMPMTNCNFIYGCKDLRCGVSQSEEYNKID